VEVEVEEGLQLELGLGVSLGSSVIIDTQIVQLQRRFSGQPMSNVQGENTQERIEMIKKTQRKSQDYRTGKSDKISQHNKINNYKHLFKWEYFTYNISFICISFLLMNPIAALKIIYIKNRIIQKKYLILSLNLLDFRTYQDMFIP